MQIFRLTIAKSSGNLESWKLKFKNYKKILKYFFILGNPAIFSIKTNLTCFAST
jgi:hypothetical protein